MKVTPPADGAPPTALLSATFAGGHTAELDVTVEEFKMQEALVAKDGPAKKMWRGKTPENLALRVGRKTDRSPMIILYMDDSEGKEHIACVLRIQWLRSCLDEDAADRVAIEIMMEVGIAVAAGKLKTSPDMYKHRDRILKERGCIEKGTVDGAPAAAGCTTKQHEDRMGLAKKPETSAENKRKVSETDAPEKGEESAAAPKKAKRVAVAAAKKDEELLEKLDGESDAPEKSEESAAAPKNAKRVTFAKKKDVVSLEKLDEEFFDQFPTEHEEDHKTAGKTALKPSLRITGKVAPAAEAADATAYAATKAADETAAKGTGKAAAKKAAKAAKAATAAGEIADKVRPPTKAAKKTADRVRAASPVARYACDFMDAPDISF